MRQVLYKSVPFAKEDVTLALESGVDGCIVPAAHTQAVAQLARCAALAEDDCPTLALHAKADEDIALARLRAGERLVLAHGWEIIPVENLLAQSDNIYVEVTSLDDARLAFGILERGVAGVVVLPRARDALKAIVAEAKVAEGTVILHKAVISAVRPAGLGHRVCVDTLSVLKRGQGMLVGNSSAFTFLVHAETEHNEYVAARPFRVNAGAVHAYTQMPGDRTTYLGELHAGQDVLIVDANGATQRVTVGRVKVEVRPMLMIEARIGESTGTIFLQNAETIRLTTPDGIPLSVVNLREGDTVLCHMDTAGRHFGMRVSENIQEI